MRFLDPVRPVSLYIHFPFCTRKCSYCAFYSLSKPFWTISPDQYGELILARLDELSQIQFSTIYLGGGNPGLLSDGMLISIIEKARSKCTEEITVEMNPEQISKERLERLNGHITRLSVGIQSLNQKNLDVLGRNSNRSENITALKLLKESGINFNADLMCAIPGQTISEVICDIRELSSYEPDHISYYCLTFEEGTPLYSMQDKRDEDLEVEALISGWKELSALGYEHYEVSNFARKNKYSKHNLNYWNLGQYIGLGPASESSLGYSRIVSYHEKEDLKGYLENKRGEVEELTRIEGMLEYLMVSLRTKWGISKKELLERFCIDFDSTFASSLKELDERCYVNTDNNFSLTEQGWMILDSIILTLSMAL